MDLYANSIDADSFRHSLSIFWVTNKINVQAEGSKLSSHYYRASSYDSNIFPLPGKPPSFSPLVKLLTAAASRALKVVHGMGSTRNLGILVTAEVSIDTVTLPVNLLGPRGHSPD